MPANADNSNAKRAGHHPSNPQEIRKSAESAANSPTPSLTHVLIGKMIVLGPKELCWTQEDLAEKAGYDVKTIQNVKGAKTKRADTLRDLRV